MLFPRIDVLARGGKVIEFGYESFALFNLPRAPGASVPLTQFGYEGKPFSLEQFALDTPLPREFIEDTRQVPGIDLGKRAVNNVMNMFSLSLEVEQAKIATDPANFAVTNKKTLSGTGFWNNAASDPIADIEAGKEAVRKSCGMEPNRMVLGNPAFKALKAHPKIVERFKYVLAESITAKMLAGLFDLEEVAVGRSVYATDTTAPKPVFTDSWGNNAVLGYTPVQDAAMDTPSFGYTYTLKGHPFVEQPRWDGDTRSWLYGVTYERAPVLTGIGSGFLFQTVTGV